MGRPEITATSAKRRGELGQQRRHARGAGARLGRVRRRWPASVPSKSRNSALRAGSAASGCRSAGRRAAASPRRGQRQEPAVVVVPPGPADDHDDVGAGDAVDRRGRRERQHLGRLHADGGGDGRRRLPAGPPRSRRPTSPRWSTASIGRLHRPAAGADDRRVVRGQPVGARGVGHDDAHRGVGHRRRRGGRAVAAAVRASMVVVVVVVEAAWPAAAVVVVDPLAVAVVVVVVVRAAACCSRSGASRRRRGRRPPRRRGRGRPPPGRSRASPTSPGVLRPSSAFVDSFGIQPAVPPRPMQAFPLVARAGRPAGL